MFLREELDYVCWLNSFSSSLVWQNEWETTGKRGKKKPKAKPEEREETHDNGAADNTQFGGPISGSRGVGGSNRGRPAQRNTSSRGGRGGGGPSAPRPAQQDDSCEFFFSLDS